MSDSRSGGGGDSGPCKRCCISIIALGLTSLSLWLILRISSQPICYIQGFYVPALDKTLNSTTTNTSIYFVLELDNPNRFEGIYYDFLGLTIYYYFNSNQTYLTLGGQGFDGFYQGRKKNTLWSMTVETSGVPWGEISGAVSNGSMPVFNVFLDTSLTFKILSSKTKKRELMAGADVMVNGSSGVQDNQNGVRLESAGALEIRPLVIGSTIILFNLLSIT